MLFEKAGDVVYGLYGGLLVANIAMVLIGLVILTPCIWLVNRPKPWMIAFIMALALSGVYSVHQSMFEIGLVLGIGVLGYILRYCKVPLLPMVLGVVLGFMIESNYRRSLLLSGGDLSIFVTDKVALGLLVLASLLTAYSLWHEFREGRRARPVVNKELKV
jgi:putative tricarboxylic transport membrane protein